MKNIIRTSALVLVGALATTALFAQNTSTIQGSARVEIISPIDIELVSNLSFGTLLADVSTTELVVPPDGPSNFTAGGRGSQANLGAWAAQYQVTGEPSTSFNVVLPEMVYLTHGEDGGQLQVHSFSTNLGENAALDSSGFAELAVGATLKLGQLQKSGIYTGTFDITVAYN